MLVGAKVMLDDPVRGNVPPNRAESANVMDDEAVTDRVGAADEPNVILLDPCMAPAGGGRRLFS